MSDDNLEKRIEQLETKLGILEDVHALRRLHLNQKTKNRFTVLQVATTFRI